MRVAAIDCGTNSIRLLIADIDNGNFREIYRAMEIVRLGEGVDEKKVLDLDAIARTLTCVKMFGDEITRRGVEKIRFCATSATRDATNRELFTSGVQEIHGITPEVIPGLEEAQLSFIGATKELPRSSSPFLVVDIGGGSTEFVFGSERVTFAQSVNIGCVRMSERHNLVSPLTPSVIAKVTHDIDVAIASVAKNVPITEAETVVAVAGTATTVAAANLKLDTYDRRAIHLSRTTSARTHEIAKMFSVMNRAEISALGYMHPGRVDVIAAGSLILSRIMLACGADEFLASESDILDGMAWSLVTE